MGPGSIPTGAVDTYSNLEDLCDKLLASSENMFVIVNHGNPQRGLIIPFTANTSASATGLIIDDLATMANAISSLSSGDNRVIDAASKMGVQVTDALRLIVKLARLQAKQRVLFLRGCNLGANLTMLSSYRAAFGAAAVQAPNCRMFYLRIRPHKPARRQSIGGLSAGIPATANTRRRTFTDQSSYLDPLIIDVRDIDGHTQVDNEAFADHPTQAAQWGSKILPQWQAVTGQNQFVIEVLWDDNQLGYMTPLEFSYRQRLVFGQ
jgi:hypothetical protein